MASDEESTTPPKNVYKDPDDGRQRFLLELEFVQCLANPTYIHSLTAISSFSGLSTVIGSGRWMGNMTIVGDYLAQNRYFEDEAFIGYLKYLQYWQRPEYIKFIMYPHCLFFLERLQDPNFRNAMAHPQNKELAHRQQFYFWRNYRNNRLKHILPKPFPEAANTSSAALPTIAATPPSNVVPPPNVPLAPQAPPPSLAAQAPSPMQSTLMKPIGGGVDKRKRK